MAHLGRSTKPRVMAHRVLNAIIEPACVRDVEDMSRCFCVGHNTNLLLQLECLHVVPPEGLERGAVGRVTVLVVREPLCVCLLDEEEPPGNHRQTRKLYMLSVWSRAHRKYVSRDLLVEILWAVDSRLAALIPPNVYSELHGVD